MWCHRQYKFVDCTGIRGPRQTVSINMNHDKSCNLINKTYISIIIYVVVVRTEIQLCRLHTRGSWQTLYWSQFLSTWTYYQQKLHFYQHDLHFYKISSTLISLYCVAIRNYHFVNGLQMYSRSTTLTINIILTVVSINMDLFLSTRVAFRPMSLRNHLVWSLCHRQYRLWSYPQNVQIVNKCHSFLSTLHVVHFYQQYLCFYQHYIVGDFYQQSLCFYQHELHTSNKCGCVYRYRITIESCTATFRHNDAGHFYQHLLSFLSTSCFYQRPCDCREKYWTLSCLRHFFST